MEANDRFRVLAAAALMDGSIGPQEKELLDKAAVELRLDKRTADGIVAEVKKNGDLTASVPTDPRNRAIMFRSLVDIVAADGKIDAREMALLQRLGPSFGLNELEVEDLLRAAAEATRSRTKRL
jgi:uncharacterized membrane protein YebE (DUF533 family)